MTTGRIYRIFACAILALGTTTLYAEDAVKPDAPKSDTPAPDAPKADAPKTDAPASDAPKADAPKSDAPASDAPKADAPAPDAPKADTAKLAISDDAQKVITEAADAYSKLKSLELAGAFAGDFDAGGQTQKGNITFTASFEAPNKFVHNAKEGEGLTVGSTGEKVYLYVKNENGYVSETAPKDKVATKSLPNPIPRIISMQNPSLMLALAKDPAHELTEDTTAITKLADTKVGDVECPTLKFVQKGGESVDVSFDPTTHLIRHALVDVKVMLEKRGVPNVKKAMYTIDYTTTTPDAAVKADQFAWAPPAGAKDMKAAAADNEQSPADALVGKDAPPVKLDGLDGKTVTLADLKGKVVVLDLWATWCPPCRASLPHLDEFYQKNKEAGVLVYAVNEQEDKEKVSAFVTKTKLGVPVLLDTDGKVGGDYKATGIPETVIIGKDGKVVKVIVGFDPNSTPEELAKAVAEAMKK